MKATARFAHVRRSPAGHTAWLPEAEPVHVETSATPELRTRVLGVRSGVGRVLAGATGKRPENIAFGDNACGRFGRLHFQQQSPCSPGDPPQFDGSHALDLVATPTTLSVGPFGDDVEATANADPALGDGDFGPSGGRWVGDSSDVAWPLVVWTVKEDHRNATGEGMPQAPDTFTSEPIAGRRWNVGDAACTMYRIPAPPDQAAAFLDRAAPRTVKVTGSRVAVSCR